MITHPTSTPSGSPFAFALTREELYVVLRLIKAQWLPGFDESWLRLNSDGQPTAESQSALVAATDALVARGFVTLQRTQEQAMSTDQVRLHMPSPVVALVGACAFANYTFLLEVRSGHSYPHQFYFHQLRNVAVAHTTLSSTIHQFEALNGREGVLTAAKAALDLGSQSKLAMPEGDITEEIMERARELAVAGAVERSTAELIQGGLLSETATIFAQTLGTATVFGTIGIARSDQPGGEIGAALAYAASQHVCFMVTAEHPRSVHVQSSSAADVLQWIEARLPTIL